MKYKRVSEAQQKRDKARVKAWEGKKNDNSGSELDTDNIMKQRDIVSSHHVGSTSNPNSVTRPKEYPISTRTRSRLDSNAPAFTPAMSPVPQVDGLADHNPRVDNPTLNTSRREPTPAWAKALCMRVDESLKKAGIESSIEKYDLG